MTLPATDAFTGTNGTALSTYSASWTDSSSGMEIQTNRANGSSTGGATHMAWWNADTFASAHYSKGTIAGTLEGGQAPGPAVRCQSGAVSYYSAFCDSNTVYCGEVIAGSPTDWDSGQAFSVNDQIELRIDQGTTTTVHLYINGTLDTTYTGKNALSNGAAGVCMYNNSDNLGIDDWEGGDTGGGGGSPTIKQICLLGVGL